MSVLDRIKSGELLQQRVNQLSDKLNFARSRITPYIKTEILDEFKTICGGKKGMQSEIVEKLMIQFIDEFNKSKK